MNRDHVLLGVAGVALLGAYLGSRPAVVAAINNASHFVGVSLTPSNTDVNSGPAYLVSNQPYFLGDPSSGVLPSVAQQTVGANASPIAAFFNPRDTEIRGG